MKQRIIIKRFFVLSAIFLSFHGYSQKNNQFDNSGLKQGLWLNYQIDTIKRLQIVVWKIPDKDIDSSKNETDRDEHNNNTPNYNKIEIKHQLISKGKYLDDKPEETWTFYYDAPLIDTSKTIENIVFYKHDSVIFYDVFQKEIIKSEVEYKSGRLNGIYKMYYKNGLLKSELSFSDNKPIGKMRIYYDNGKLMFSGEILPDERFYQVTEYYKTGSKRYEKKLSADYVIENFTDLKERE